MDRKLLLICISLLCLFIIYHNMNNINYLENKPIKSCYFDNNATTTVPTEIISKMSDWISCGNPSNILYECGKRSSEAIKNSRQIISDIINIQPDELFFTSGATESNNIIIQGVANYHRKKSPTKKFHIITSAFEHPSVTNICKYLENDNFEITYIKPVADIKDKYYGTINPLDVQNAIKNNTILITIMHGNNETGALQNIHAIGYIGKQKNIFTHSDCTQTMGKFLPKPHELELDSISFSGHKFHAPKGVGAVFINKEKQPFVKQLMYGGDQERTFRPGTENVANIVALGEAMKFVSINRNEKNTNLLTKKNFILQNLKLNGVNYKLLGPTDKDRVMPNTLFMVFPDLETCNRVFVEELNKYGVCVSIGSACKTQKAMTEKITSHVLDTMDLSDDDKIKVIRISLSDLTTIDECKYLIHVIRIIMDKLKKL